MLNKEFDGSDILNKEFSNSYTLKNNCSSSDMLNKEIGPRRENSLHGTSFLSGVAHKLFI